METSHCRYFTKIKSSAFTFCRSPTWRFHHCVVMCEGSDCQSCGGPRQRWPPSIPPSLHPYLLPLHSSFPPVSVLPVCLDGSTSLSACEGRLFSLQARSRQEIGPRGPEDVKLLTRPVNLGCPISTARSARSNENTNEAWGWTFLRPFSHKPLGSARRIILCCPSFLTSELSTSAKSPSFHPWRNKSPNPNLLAIKVFTGRLLT